MNLSSTAQAILLLTSYFNTPQQNDIKPLTNTEWGRFALWLKTQKMTPADLLLTNSADYLKKWNDPHISAERIVTLLQRGHALAFSFERWERAGLWVVTRSDAEYPKRLKQRLTTNAPPFFFGCGQKTLLNAGGLAVVGSRHTQQEELAFTTEIGQRAALAHIPIISGGAVGVDQTAMQSALNQNGVVIGILANNLLNATVDIKWRQGLSTGKCVLISTTHPEAGFHVGHAMARNKYIYCLADQALVVHANQTGGTITGAQENLKAHWVPLWVKHTTDPNAANAHLVREGGKWCSANAADVDLLALFQSSQGTVPTPSKIQDLFEDYGAIVDLSPAAQPSLHYADDLPTSFTPQAQDSFYMLFLEEFKKHSTQPIPEKECLTHFPLHKSQLKQWLERAIQDNLIKKIKIKRRICYQWHAI